jgi:hypothetical protein
LAGRESGPQVRDAPKSHWRRQFDPVLLDCRWPGVGYVAFPSYSVCHESTGRGGNRHKNWAKVVYSVDTSVSSGWAYDGEFVAAGAIQDVPAGGVLLVYGERGSRSNPVIEARVYQINPEGTLSERGVGKGRGWARTLRDTVEQLLADDAPVPLADLSGYADVELIEELTRRGYQVEGGSRK